MSDATRDFYPPPNAERMSSTASLVPVGIVAPAFLAGDACQASTLWDGWPRLGLATAGFAFLILSMLMGLATMFRLRQAAAWAHSCDASAPAGDGGEGGGGAGHG